MCFASSIVESHKKLFIANLNNNSECVGGGGSAATTSTATVASSRTISSSDKKRASSNYNTGSSAIDGVTTKSATVKMSRSKSRLQAEVCGDCGASDPSWASINRGILLCSDCCSVHRSLGRHISIVKSLRQGTWEPSVLNFVNSLNAHGANSVWEHHLLDGITTTNAKGAQRIRKPSPKDPVHPNKSDFIKAKHVNLSFVLKPNFQDDDNVSGGSLEQELSKQLHASVRTSNLETSLRLLVQGADPNYFHEEKRSTPLHVASKFGQSSQIELLLVYGGDINALDGNNLTPLEVAKYNNHTVVAERLLDAMYEVTDRIIMFLGGKKPDHMTGRHLVIPDTGNNDISEQLKIARGRLHLVPNKMFEELVMDLYDEVDRRENEAIWATTTLNADTVAVPFLPANPFLSATRNQGRQKLARFSRDEFYGLLTDVLNDAHRRQKVANLNPLDPTATNTTNSYYNQNTTISATNSTLYNIRNIKNNEHDANLSDDEPIYDPVASDDDYAALPPLAQQNTSSTTISPNRDSSIEMINLRKQLSYYKCEVDQLKNVVQKLSSENSELKSKYSNKSFDWSTTSAKAASTNSVYDEPLRIDLNGSGDHDTHEPRSLPADTNVTLRSISNASPQSSGSTSTSNSNQSTIKRPVSMYERRVASSLVAGGKTTLKNLYSMPFGTVVQLHSDIVTARIKELVNAMEEVDPKVIVTIKIHGERLRDAIKAFITIFSSPPSENVRKRLSQLTENNLSMQYDVENLQNSFNNDNKSSDIEKYRNLVRNHLIHIVSALKFIRVETENDN